MSATDVVTDAVKKNGSVIWRVVNVALVFAGFIFLAGRLDAKVENNSKRIEENKEHMLRIEDKVDRNGRLLTRILVRKEKE